MSTSVAKQRFIARYFYIAILLALFASLLVGWFSPSTVARAAAPTISTLEPLSGVINDPTDLGTFTGVNFTVNDAETAPANLIVTATSSNQAVVDNANLTVSAGVGGNRTLKVKPSGVGYSNITITVSDGTSTASTILRYASSAASVTPATSRFHTGKADASTAIAVDASYMLVADDEDQTIRLYNRQSSGAPVNSFDYTASLGLTDFSGGVPREVDIEASARAGNRIYWLASHSNASSGNNRPNRSRLFATDISGTGAATTLSYVGRYDTLKIDLINWDQTNVHGKGLNFYGLAASAATGVVPESANGSGFNIEGLEFAPGSTTTAYVAFRAPISPANVRTKALIVPVTNFNSLVTANPTIGPATFGASIELDLGGRGIREIRKNSNDEYVIIAGPADSATGVAPKDFRLYTWTGNGADAPVLQPVNLTALNSGGSFESIVEVPAPLLNSSLIQLLSDNGDTIWYNDGIAAKDLLDANFKKFRSDIINLAGTPPVTQVAFTTQPGGVQTGNNLNPQPVVAVQDAIGNTFTNFNGAVTLAIKAGTGTVGATLSGTTTVIAVNGVATFTNLAISSVGTGYVLTASSAGLTAADSTPFNISALPATKVVFTTQPGGVQTGSNLNPQPIVAVQDANGTVVATFNGAVTLAIKAGTGTAGATLSGTTTVNAVNGVATFTNLAISSVGTGYVLTASSAGLTAADSSALSITAQPPPTANGTIKLLGNTVRIKTTQGGANAKLVANGGVPSVGDASTTKIKAGGANNIPATATGIIGIVTNIECESGGNLRFWTGATTPNSVNLNIPGSSLAIPGASFALNLSTSFTAALDANGELNLGWSGANTKACGYAVDVIGYIVPLDPTASTIVTLDSPVRVKTTQGGANAKLVANGGVPSVGDASTTKIKAGGANNIPATATGIIGIVTNIECESGGNLRFWTGATTPNSVNLNIPGSSLAIPGASFALNLSTSFTAALNTNGELNLGWSGANTKACGYAVDVIGYIAPAGVGKNITILSSTQRVSTTQGGANAKLVANGGVPSVGEASTTKIKAGGANNIPATATGIIGIVTNIECESGGNLRFWTGATTPNSVNLNIPGSSLAIPGASFALNLSTSFTAALNTNGELNLGWSGANTKACGYAVDVTAFLS